MKLKLENLILSIYLASTSGCSTCHKLLYFPPRTKEEEKMINELYKDLDKYESERWKWREGYK